MWNYIIVKATALPKYQKVPATRLSNFNFYNEKQPFVEGNNFG